MGLIEQVGKCLILYIETHTHTHIHLPLSHTQHPPATCYIMDYKLSCFRLRHKENNRLASLIRIVQISDLIRRSLKM